MLRRTKPLALALVLFCATSVPHALAQDIHAVSSGSVQSVRAGVTQNVRAGAIARSTGGERSGLGGFATSEGRSRVVTGRVSGYGARQGAGGLGEYASQSTASFGAGSDFPRTDFVTTMPRPSAIEYGAFTNGAGVAGFGVTLSPVPTRASTVGRSGGSSHRPAHHALKDPEAILNPFTHTIGPSIGSSLPGSGALKETVLGAPKIQ